MSRRICDVCGLLGVEHPEPLGNGCYARAVASRFPRSAPDSQPGLTPLERQKAKERGMVLQTTMAGYWRALGRTYGPSSVK